MFLLIFLINISLSRDFRKNILNLNRRYLLKAIKINKSTHTKHFILIDVQIDKLKTLLKKCKYQIPGEKKRIFNEFEIFMRRISELQLDCCYNTEKILYDEIIYNGFELYKGIEYEEIDHLKSIEQYKIEFYKIINNFFSLLSEKIVKKSYDPFIDSIDNYILYVKKWVVCFAKYMKNDK